LDTRPDRLGEYLLVDYLSHQRKKVQRLPAASLRCLLVNDSSRSSPRIRFTVFLAPYEHESWSQAESRMKNDRKQAAQRLLNIQKQLSAFVGLGYQRRLYKPSSPL